MSSTKHVKQNNKQLKQNNKQLKQNNKQLTQTSIWCLCFFMSTIKQAYSIIKIKNKKYGGVKMTDRTYRTDRTDRIDIIYICSQHNILSLTGRFPCISIRDSGLFTILTDDGWVHLKVHTDEIQRLKEIASRDRGSLYLRIRPSGVGYVLDEEPSL